MSNSNQFHIKSKDLLERLTGYWQWFKKAVAKGFSQMNWAFCFTREH